MAVSTHSRPKAAGMKHACSPVCSQFQHTAARRRLKIDLPYTFCENKFQHTAARRRLGCIQRKIFVRSGFNTQPPEGGCGHCCLMVLTEMVSTHSRPKAAVNKHLYKPSYFVSTHSRPKAAEATFNGALTL